MVSDDDIRLSYIRNSRATIRGFHRIHRSPKGDIGGNILYLYSMSFHPRSSGHILKRIRQRDAPILRWFFINSHRNARLDGSSAAAAVTELHLERRENPL